MAQQPTNNGRKQDGRFTRGHCANPKGRPRGALNNATRVAQALIDGEAEALSRKAIALALEGDPHALRLCMERLLPKRNDRLLSLPLPPISGVQDILPALDAVLRKAAEGHITPAEAKSFGDLLSGYVRCYEQVAIEERLQRLEEQVGMGEGYAA